MSRSGVGVLSKGAYRGLCSLPRAIRKPPQQLGCWCPAKRGQEATRVWPSTLGFLQLQARNEVTVCFVHGIYRVWFSSGFVEIFVFWSFDSRAPCTAGKACDGRKRARLSFKNEAENRMRTDETIRDMLIPNYARYDKGSNAARRAYVCV